MKKLVVIGPVYPFKGGIAHYTGMMIKNLQKEYEVFPISYKMQYPKILHKKEQYDYQNDTCKIENTEFLINTANPFNWFSVASKIKNLNPDYIIVQWWHPYFSPCYTGLLSLLKKYPIIFICHNVFPHESFPLDRFLTRRVLNRGDAFITHSRMDAEDIKTIISNPVFAITAIPTFNAFKLINMTYEEGRTALGIDINKKILLFFGFVREYKGLKWLIKAMPEILNYDCNIELMVVGEFGSNKDSYVSLIKEYGVEESVIIVDGYIPDKDIEQYFAACDLVVLPYESATQSGVVQIAYGFEKPVVATNVGGLPEVVIDGKTGYVVEPYNPHDIAQAVVRFFAEKKAAEFSANVCHETDKYSWDKMNEVVKSITERI